VRFFFMMCLRIPHDDTARQTKMFFRTKKVRVLFPRVLILSNDEVRKSSRKKIEFLNVIPRRELESAMKIRPLFLLKQSHFCVGDKIPP